MGEIVHQYGRTLCISVVTALLVFTLFYGNGDGGVLQYTAKKLTSDVPHVTNAAESVSQKEFMKEGIRIRARTDLKAQATYQTGDIFVSAEGSKVTGGKILSADRIYDGKSGEEVSESLSEEAIGTNGRTIVFPDRGLYRLCLSVKDKEVGDSLQYVFVAVEETDEGE